MSNRVKVPMIDRSARWHFHAHKNVILKDETLDIKPYDQFLDSASQQLQVRLWLLCDHQNEIVP